MPKTKKQEESSDSDSGPADRNPPKKSKSNTSPNKSNDEEDSWTLGKSRFLKVREFKGKFYVDIREFYNADGELKPGKKGISLSLEQWNILKSCIDDVDSAIKRKV